MVLFVAGGSLVVGCGSSMPKSDAAPPPSLGEDTGEDAQNELDRGEWRITELFGPPGGAAPEAQATASPSASSAPVTPAPNGGPVSTDAAKQADGEKPADACGVACSALASMERAARHLCELAGPAEPRCQSARERVRNANDRVATHCTCGL
ncbi:MAG: hypothetical protein U0441_24315 [Polyangiaceae bacterium]